MFQDWRQSLRRDLGIGVQRNGTKTLVSCSCRTYHLGFMRNRDAHLTADFLVAEGRAARQWRHRWGACLNVPARSRRKGVGVPVVRLRNCKQISHETWPSTNTLPLAVIDLAPVDIPEVIFEESVDGLGRILFAVIEMQSKIRLGLVWHSSRPNRGIEIYIESGLGLRLQDVVDELSDCLGLQPDQMAWVSPRVLLD